MSAQTATADRELAFFLDLNPPLADFRADVLEGLAASPKVLSPKHLYDERGSVLFEAVTAMPEYYVPRIEAAIMSQALPAIADFAGPGAAVIELGAGASVKVRALLDALDAPNMLAALDISGDHLRSAIAELSPDYPKVRVGGIAADFTERLRLEADFFDGAGKRLVFFPGSTIGNFEPSEAKAILASARALLRPGDGLLVGADLVKHADVLRLAYDDPAGVTAKFISNILVRINAELGGDFDHNAFAYAADWSPERLRIEMDLESRAAQTVHVGDQAFSFSAGERIAVSQSRKFTVDGFQAFAAEARFAPVNVWTDEHDYFSVHLFEAA